MEAAIEADLSAAAQMARMGLTELYTGVEGLEAALVPTTVPAVPAPKLPDPGELLGALAIETVKISGLPSTHTILHRHWTPFVVAAFGSSTHRTATGKAEEADPTTVNLSDPIPTIGIDGSEKTWEIGFSIWDSRSGANKRIGVETLVHIKDLVGPDVFEKESPYWQFEEGMFEMPLHGPPPPASGTRFPVMKELQLQVPQAPTVEDDLDVDKLPPIHLTIRVGFLSRAQLVRNLVLNLLHNLRNHGDAEKYPFNHVVTIADTIMLAHLNLGPFYKGDGSERAMAAIFAGRAEIPLDEFAAAWDAAQWEPTGTPGGLDSTPGGTATCISCGNLFPPPDPAVFMPYPLQQRDHLLLCASRTIAERKVEVKDRWASTESRAATGKVQWAAGSLLSRLGFGKYQAGEVDGHILVRNRESGLLEEEFIPAFVRLGIQLLYRNRVSQSAAETAVVERMLKKASVAHGVSYDLPVSKAVIPSFVATYSINVDEIEKPLSEYTTMNEFFGRRLKPGARRLEDPDDPNCVPSVADCRLTVFPTNAAAEKIWIKGSGFSIGRLLDDPIRGKEFEGATLAIHRLAPQDYHRWNVPLSGRILGFKKIRHPGQYYTVNPMAIRSPVDVFGDNVRDICYIDTGTKLGTVALVAVGAMMVASIIWSVTEGQEVKKFDDMGTFHFGGSTVIVLFKKGTVKLDQDLIESSERALETVLRVGDRIGTMIV